MTPIKELSGLNPELKKLEQRQSTRRIQPPESKPGQEAGATKSAGGIPQDKVSISREAKTLYSQKISAEEYARLLDGIKTLTNEEKEKIQERIRTGRYNRDDVYQIVANRLVRSGTVGRSPESPAGESLNEVADRVQGGYYDSDEVIDTITERLLNSGDL
ncbi:MAG: hypothetical protein D6762_09605 [Candidatus Neomarinimicrobiota bacterium]|nr:MAG: hypothetical protein D6762_09605 [Candidatus Neomarinimicrobiota bacterium]